MKRLDETEQPVICAFKCLPHEKDLLVAAATHRGLNLSAFLRQLVRYLPMPDQQPLIVKPLEEYDPTPNIKTTPLTATVEQPPKPSAPPLCDRCCRIGQPCCPACRQAYSRMKPIPYVRASR